MGKNHFALKSRTRFILLPGVLFLYSSFQSISFSQNRKAVLEYTISMPEPSTHYYHVELSCIGWLKDTIEFKMARWMPGYYQIMNYAREVKNFTAKERSGKNIPVKTPDENTWQIIIKKNTPFKLIYEVKADRKFVANSYLDSTHGYIVPAATFLYIKDHLNTPVSVKLVLNKQQDRIATGLDPVPGKTGEFTASDFDVLFDCPILTGELEELPSFRINNIEHRFIGYRLGRFDREEFMKTLKKVVQAGIEIVGDIPYKQFTFIGIGPGNGGIEHLNNTTISFDGNGLNKKESVIRMMNFLAHEYFHNYNVKRIRPYELGPFDYDRENKTNLLWVSEGLSVYYEYLMVKRAGLINEQELYSNFESSLNAIENNPGRLYQSLVQASFNTWNEGPFGKKGKDASKSISYYDKGPGVGMILDFSIRNATGNKKSLDDVMQLLYWQYYKKLQRGFTDAEFQQACEAIAGISLNSVFEYVYTAREVDYNSYLSFAGLKLTVEPSPDKSKSKFKISRLDSINPFQNILLQSWLGQ